MMKNKKSLKARLTAGLMSAAMLTSASVPAMMSMPVNAADGNDYYEALALSLYFFDANACGDDVDAGPLTWRGDCHTYDEYPGGYHDAGDHIKFNLTMGFAGSSLAMAEYLNPGVFEKAGCKDHLVAILKRNADYLMSTTTMNGDSVEQIAHVVADGNMDHSYWTSPEEQTYSRTTYYLTAGNNNSAVCGEMAAALAGTAYVVKDSDPAYAEQCLKYAKALVAFGKDHVGNNTEGLNGFYGTDPQYQDEIALAEAWLYICGAGDKPTLVPEGGGKYSDNVGYDGYRYCWDKVFQGYAALMYKATGDSMWATELETEIQKQGGLSVGNYNGDGWGASRYNCALQMSGYAVANGDANNQYAKAGKWQMDYLLGDNPTGYSFLIGYGDKYPTHIHHRAANPGDGNQTSVDNPEAKYTLYGALVGGIDGGGSYEDHADRYQYTEPALDYNGCFVLACAALADLYGGTDAGAANIISNASEITYPFSFGNGSSVTPTPPPTEPTSETTTATEPVSSEETTAPTEPTTQPNDPVETTTQQQQQQQPSGGEKEATLTEKQGEGNSTYWTVDTTGASKLTITCKTNSADTAANGAFNPPGGWTPENWELTNISGGTFTVTYDVPAGQNSVDFYLWWPTEATIEKAVLTMNGGGEQQPSTSATTAEQTPTTTTTTTTVQDNPQPTQPTNPTQPTEPTNPSGGDLQPTKPGDADLDNEVNILDVIFVNRAILGKSSLTEQGLVNIDFNHNKIPEPDEALTIMKRIVNILTDDDLRNA